jgi:hypothetical protein
MIALAFGASSSRPRHPDFILPFDVDRAAAAWPKKLTSSLSSHEFSLGLAFSSIHITVALVTSSDSFSLREHLAPPLPCLVSSFHTCLLTSSRGPTSGEISFSL